MRRVALGTDAVVVERSQLRIELHGEAVERAEWVAPAAPFIPPLPTSLHRTPALLSAHMGEKASRGVARSRYSQEK